MQEKYRVTDMSIREITPAFIEQFYLYIRKNVGCAHNTAMKFIQRFRTIVNFAKSTGLVVPDPFVNYKFRFERTDRGYLTQEEIERIMDKKFSTKRLEQVKDIFVFSCFCGLAYIDVKNLRKNNIRTSFDGSLWIMGKREKTGVCFNIPLLDIPQMILDKYKGKLPHGHVLPVLSNQKTNSYLKEIGDVCGIDKNLTFHLARHTFATFTLSKGVSIESVSKMLGHTNIRTTQIYARITDSKISDDMALFAGKVKGMERKYTVNL
jgi:site-specific recombinase XerD